MKHAGVIVTFALLAAVPCAHAAGIGLRWGSCQGSSNRSFACDLNTGSELLVVSFSPPGGITELTGIEGDLQVVAESGKVPVWWQMASAGSCRRFSIAAVLDVSDQAECDDPWEGQGMGGIARYVVDANGVDLRVGIAIPPSQKHALSPGKTYAAFKLQFDHKNSNGVGACSGCATPVCITFNRLVIAQYVQPPYTVATRSRDVEITLGLSSNDGRPGNMVTWQGGTPNCGAGLARPSSWSQLKDRFRNR